MSDVTLSPRSTPDSARPVISGDLIMALSGNWTAHVDLDGEALDGKVTLRWLDTDLAGFVLRCSEFEGRTQALIVGGDGGLWRDMAARSYANTTPARTLIEQLLQEAGERLAMSSSADALTKTVPLWARIAGTCGAQLDEIARAIGATWRVLADGTIWVGTETTWPSAPAELEIIEEEPGNASAQLAPEILAPLPGQALDGRHVGAVRFSIVGEEVRVTAWFQDGQNPQDDPLRAGIYALAREAVTTDYLAVYPCKVITQRPDGTVDVQPDSQRIPPMTNVPLRAPCHGAKLVVPSGSRAVLGFDAGQPSRPFVALWDHGDGDKAVARVDDQVDCGRLTVTATAMGTFVGTYVDPFGTTTVFSLGTPIPLKGKVITGSPHLRLKAGNTP